MSTTNSENLYGQVLLFSELGQRHPFVGRHEKPHHHFTDTAWILNERNEEEQ